MTFQFPNMSSEVLLTRPSTVVDPPLEYRARNSFGAIAKQSRETGVKLA